MFHCQNSRSRPRCGRSARQKLGVRKPLDRLGQRVGFGGDHPRERRRELGPDRKVGVAAGASEAEQLGNDPLAGLDFVRGRASRRSGHPPVQTRCAPTHARHASSRCWCQAMSSGKKSRVPLGLWIFTAALLGLDDMRASYPTGSAASNPRKFNAGTCDPPHLAPGESPGAGHAASRHQPAAPMRGPSQPAPGHWPGAK